MSIVRWLALGALVAIAGIGLSVARLIWPATDSPARRADAIFVLSGDHGERLAEAKKLLAARAAPVLVFDGELDTPEAQQLCAGAAAPYLVVCLAPRPDNTRAEAQVAGSLVQQRSWKRIIVVTTSYHVTRARLLFDRCVSGSVAMVAAPPPYGRRVAAGQIRHEWLGVVYALTVKRGC
ncbi:MAG: YdcF family protein [Acidimicrobiales bacterium]